MVRQAKGPAVLSQDLTVRNDQVSQFVDPQDGQGAFPFERIWIALIRQRWLVLIALIVGFGVGTLLSFTPRKYTSSGTLRIEPSRGNMYQISPSQALSGGSALDAQLNTEVLVLGSESLLLKVARDLDLANKPEFFAPARKGHQFLSSPSVQDAVLKLLYGSLVVIHVPNSEVVRISATTRSAALSANLTNTLINDYISDSLETRYGSTQRVSKWLIGQLGELKTQVQDDQEQLVDLESRLGVLTVDPKNSTYLNAEALAGLSKASSEATINRVLAEARYRSLQESDPELIEREQPLLSNAPGSNSLIQSLRSEQAVALADYASLTARFGANYPPVKEAKAKVDTIAAEIKAEQDRILNQARTDYSAAAANEKMTTSALTSQQKEAFSARNDIVRFAILQREYESHRLLYESLVQRLEEAGVNSGLQSAEVDTIDLARPPFKANAPSPLMWIVGTTLAVLFVGCITAVVIDMIDAKFDSISEAESVLGIPGLAILPLEPGEDQSLPFATASKPTSHYAESMQLLRNAILMSRPDGPPKVLLVTSASPSEGKSTTARELAATFAQHGSRVLLIDGDLRKPTQHTRIRLTRSPGLSTVVNGNSSLESAIHAIPAVEGLWVLTAGPTPPRSAVLWDSASMKNIIERCRKEFDFVIIDSAPVLSVADSLVGIGIVDTVLVVIRHHMVDQRTVREAIRLLARTGADISGFALNAMDMERNRYTPYYQQYNYGSYGDGAGEE